ncbi:MAG: MFS transporter [Novosphingobium sp.]|nr:MFS transporter [Novosphingobium sp.]
MIEPTSPLQIVAFRRLWLSRFASVVATNGMVVILGYQLYDIARSAYGMSVARASFQLGLLGLAQFVPLFVLTPAAGVIADRYDRRLIGAAAVGLDAGVALTLAVVTHAGGLTLPLLFGLAALHGVARVFVGPAISSIAPNVVPAVLMPRAIGLTSMAMQIGMISGPALAGLLFARSASAPYWIAAVLLAIACGALLLLPRLPLHSGNRGAHPLRQIADGFRYVRDERFLLGCITLDLFAVILAGATALLPVYARDILHVGAEGLGQMRAAPAVGAAIVGVWLSFRPFTHNVGVKMLAGVAVYGAATIAFGVSHTYPLSLALLAVLGAADMVSVFIRSSLVQLNTPDTMRGRVSSISGLAISASNELGEMESGMLASLLGAPGAVVFGGVGAIVVTLVWARLFPELPHTRTFAAHYRQEEPA